MYIIQNAWRNVFRNKGRNLLLGSITFVVIVAVVVALIIANTSTGIIEEYKDRFGSEVTLQPDMQKLQEQAMANSTDGRMRLQRPTIPPTQLLAFGESDYLQSANYTAETKANSDSLTPIDEDKGGGGGLMMGGARNGVAPQDTVGTQYYFKLLGNQFSDFESGLRSLSAGRMPTAANECVISTDLAESSGVTVGETVTVTTSLVEGESLPDPDSTEETVTRELTYSLTVVGTYDDATDEYGNNMIQNAYTNRRNEILTTFETIQATYAEGYSGIDISATFYLKSPDMLEGFASELYAKGLDTAFNVATDTASYNAVIGPVENLKNIAFIFVIVVLMIGGAIVALLASLAVRERKYEVGVLRAMGMKRATVGVGLWAELLIVTGLCLVVGLGVGTLASGPVSDVMLKSQIAATEQAQGPGANVMTSSGPQAAGAATGGQVTSMSAPLGSMRTPGTAEALTSLDVSLSWITLLQIIAVALALSTIAGLIAVVQITKYEPIKILMERN
ncbi:MAG: ABC transporter permease [Coriobacteriales bacterium]|jgi:putative ABC transport system permease protein|nr:ABC transporter permease [Coriobacteriales bacterium]